MFTLFHLKIDTSQWANKLLALFTNCTRSCSVSAESEARDNVGFQACIWEIVRECQRKEERMKLVRIITEITRAGGQKK